MKPPVTILQEALKKRRAVTGLVIIVPGKELHQPSFVPKRFSQRWTELQEIHGQKYRPFSEKETDRQVRKSLETDPRLKVTRGLMRKIHKTIAELLQSDPRFRQHNLKGGLMAINPLGPKEIEISRQDKGHNQNVVTVSLENVPNDLLQPDYSRLKVHQFGELEVDDELSEAIINQIQRTHNLIAQYHPHIKIKELPTTDNRDRKTPSSKTIAPKMMIKKG